MKWLERLSRRRTRSGQLLVRADRARVAGDWPAVTAALQAALGINPEDARLRVQLGHALKESGSRLEAIAAYRASASAMPQDVDVRIHLASLLRQGRANDEAARVYAEILGLDFEHAEALRALAEMGMRDNLPVGSFGNDAIGQRMAVLGAAVGQARSLVADWVATSAYPATAYDTFRRAYATPPPPPGAEASPFAVVVLTAGATPAMLRVTLDSLADQTIEPGAIHVVAADALAEHPAASAAGRKLAPVFGPEWPTGIGASRRILLVAAGAILDAQALAWLSFGVDRTGTSVAHGDHDRVTTDWRNGCVHAAPALFGQFDPDAIAATDDPPLAILAAGSLFLGLGDELATSAPPNAIRRILLAAGVGAVCHVPRRLASGFRLSETARHASATSADQAVGETAASSPPANAAFGNGVALSIAARPDQDGKAIHYTVAAAPAGAATVTVVIPTRDQAVMLRGCIDSLRAMAAEPARLRFLVVDNRSSDPATAAAVTAAGAERVVMDEPFNWSRANNLGAAVAGAGSLLLFANNDLTMQTRGWDEMVAGHLARSDVGTVGARLLYPDGSYQHAGVLFGVGERTQSIHDGVGAAGAAGGPAGRWLRTRAVSAVTGAFLACTRRSFDALGGFDERLAIAYNDIDWCLRVREAGLRVLYVPAITLIHHESATRGINDSRDRIAFDEVELAWLVGRWGEALRIEPGYNPQWALRGRPFDGYREPALSEVLRWIDRAAAPWNAERAATPEPR